MNLGAVPCKGDAWVHVRIKPCVYRVWKKSRCGPRGCMGDMPSSGTATCHPLTPSGPRPLHRPRRPTTPPLPLPCQRGCFLGLWQARLHGLFKCLEASFGVARDGLGAPARVCTYQQPKATGDIHACSSATRGIPLVQATAEPSLEAPSPLSLWDPSRTPPPFGDVSASEHHG